MSINLKDYSSMFKLSIKPKKLKETEKPNSLFTLAMFEKYNNTDGIFLLLVGMRFVKRKIHRQRSLERKANTKIYMRLIDKVVHYQTPLKCKVFGRGYRHMKTLKELSEYNNIDTIKKSTHKLLTLIYKSRYKCSVQEAYYTIFDDGIGYGRPMSISEFKIFQPMYLLPYKCSLRRNKGEYCVNKVFLGGLLKVDKTILPINISSNKQKTIKFRGDNV